MVYIYKKLVGGKNYYYLRASERKGQKNITKDIAYLGCSIEEIKKSLEKLPEYKGQIRKAYKTIHHFLECNFYLEKVKEQKLKKDSYLDELHIEVEACRLHYDNVFKKTEELTKKEILKNFVIEFAFNTASIEGNTITLKEARNLLEEGLTPKNKTMREIFDLQNTEEVFFELLNSQENISHDLIIDIHMKLMKNIDARRGYRFAEVRVIKSNFEATPAPYVRTDMNLLLQWYHKNKGELHPLVLAVIFHHKFEKIHPFMDGNGRTGRMLLNYILIKNKYSPLIITRKARLKYLETLRKADKSVLTKAKREDYGFLVKFAARELINSYWNSFI